MDVIIIKTRLDVGGKDDFVQTVNRFKFGKNKLMVGQGTGERWDLTDDLDKSLAEQYLDNLIEDLFYQYGDDIGVTRTITINFTKFTDMENAMETVNKLFHIYLKRMCERNGY